MAIEPVVTDLDGRPRTAVADWHRVLLTPRVNGYTEVVVAMSALDPAVADALIAQRALKVYDGGTLRHFGKLWEPLKFTQAGVELVSRDPYAEFAQRRVRAVTSYTSQDAGLIAFDRVTVQNGFRNTYLRNGTRQASANRVREYNPGTLEGDIVSKLAEADSGFFFQVSPVDGVPGVMGDLNIRYPDAGTTREEARFEYGEGTVDNLAGYELNYLLPRNRMTVASSSSTGGRISKVAEDTASIALHGLFEDESAFSDVDDLNLLEQHAKAEIRSEPPLVATITPGPEAPLLYTAFNVGDFVRLRIKHGALDIFTWVRVLEASLEALPDGQRRLVSVALELIVGGRPGETPERRFRRLLDEQRRRLEALERKVENMNSTEVAPPAAPAPGGGSGGAPPPDPTPPPPPPPPAPPAGPSISASGEQVGKASASITVSFNCGGVESGLVSIGGTIIGVSGAGSVSATKTGTPGTTLHVDCYIATSAGSASASADVFLDPAFGL